MSFPKGNLEGIQRHYSVHNLSHEIPKNDIEEEEEKKSKLQNTIHSPTEKNLRQTEADLLSQTNSQKKSLNPNEIELQEKEEDIKIENTLMFEQKNISVPKLYCHLSKQTEKILLIFGIIGSLSSGVSGPLMTQLFGGNNRWCIFITRY